MKKRRKIALTIIILIVLGTVTVLGYGYYKLSGIKTVTISKSNEDLGIKSQLKKDKGNLEQEASKVEADDEIVNIALFGLDRRAKDEAGRSDCIMLVSIDKLHKKIKVSSIMRDTYVEIKNHGKTKINHAFAYGGAQLAIATLNENFGLNIRDYVFVDFFELEKIIDYLGGVTIDVKGDEINLINGYVAEVAALEHSSFDKVTAVGIQQLNGKQAVGYSRIRYTDGGDFVRTDRQRRVLSALIEKIEGKGKIAYPTIVSKILPCIETSMSSAEILKLGGSIYSSRSINIERERFPLDGYCKGETIGGVWYLVCDLEIMSDQLHRYIYEDVKPMAGEPLF